MWYSVAVRKSEYFLIAKLVKASGAKLRGLSRKIRQPVAAKEA